MVEDNNQPGDNSSALLGLPNVTALTADILNHITSGQFPLVCKSGLNSKYVLGFYAKSSERIDA